MPHPAGAGGLPPLGLHGPPELADLGRGKAAGGAHLLLNVEGHLKIFSFFNFYPVSLL